MAPRGITVTVIGWDKFNGRKDIKNPTWFRVEYRLLEDPDFYDFSHEEFKAWLYILAQACRKNSSLVLVNFAHAKATAGLSERGIQSAINKLLSLGLVSLDDPDDSAMQLGFKRAQARSAVKTAVNNGTLTKPEQCESCGAKSYRIDGHHEDYDKPLEVQWLCPSCHGRVHTRTHAYTVDTRQDRTGQDKQDRTDETDTATSAAAELFTESTQDVLEKVSRDVQDAWLNTYPDAGWIRQELAKAWAWCKANPKKAPRSDWARFVNGWLSRGWEQHRKSIPSNRAEARSQGNQNTLNEYLARIGGQDG